MPPFLSFDYYNYIALAIMLPAIVFAYIRGRGAAWTQVPLVALVIASIGPSIFAIAIWLGYTLGIIHPGPAGYRLSTLIRDLPIDFAAANWGFAALYVICRLWPALGAAKPAMWASVAAMSLPNVALFSLAWEMVSNVFDAGQGIGVVLAMVSFPIVNLDVGFGIGPVVAALTAPIPLLGLTAWLAAQCVAWLVRE
ncbi:hypothetical protein PY365_04425 [Roseiarcaceae bacterium H3SJ34-1]|uniref:hypothetical protein n=1 Tax=Terripilifer ovatus TaxID=3032367 RepID=UPI003AB9A0F9|nr:hypothetical protein [Roseiarcaceae bacterium H3SJ34-1]